MLLYHQNAVIYYKLTQDIKLYIFKLLIKELIIFEWIYNWMNEWIKEYKYKYK